MENENRWEFDYGSNPPPKEDSGYLNVGSSGTNSANRYEQNSASAGDVDFLDVHETSGADDAPQNTVWESNGPAAHTPPEPPRRKANWLPGLKNAGRRLLSLALAAAMGFAGGFVGARMSGNAPVVVQTVERYRHNETELTTTSTAGDELSLPQVAALVGPSVVVITTEQVVYSGFSWYGQGQVQSGAGSGVIISANGHILTCAHVVDGASNITVSIGDEDYTATVVGEDPDSDIAVLKIEATGLTPAVVGDSTALAVGEGVVVVGNPLGHLGGTVTNGIVSALNRNLVVENRKLTLIQTDASISPGNSGGGLFNMAGELVGIVNAKSASSTAEGLGFAIPINTAMQVAQELLERGYVSGRPWMGVTVFNANSAEAAQQLGVTSFGVYIVSIESGSGAERGGLKAGDRIISIGGREVAKNEDVTEIVQEHRAGDTLEVTVVREGRIMTLNVTLGEKNGK